MTIICELKFQNFTELSAKALTAIEVWLVAAITFIFFSFLELGLVFKIVSCLDRETIVAGENDAQNNLPEDLERSSRKGQTYLPTIIWGYLDCS